MTGTLTAPAPAKVNLVLEVMGVRGDGYHEIDTVLQTIELADTVRISFDGEEGVAVTGPCSNGTPEDRTNLAWRAAAELARLCGRTTAGLRIELEKNIPPAGGLGGGASDAATVLRLLAQAWPEADDLLVGQAAANVGSDEPFFLLGGTGRARGRGESVTQLPELHRHGVVLFVPPFTVERKTARMFAALDQLPFDDGSVSFEFARHEPGRLESADVYNAFERVAFDVFPRLARLWQDLERRIGDPVRLAGAGPTLFWIGREAQAASVASMARGAKCTIIETATARSLWRR